MGEARLVPVIRGGGADDAGLAQVVVVVDDAEIPVLIVSGIGRLVRGIAPEQARSQNIRGVISKPVEYATLISDVSSIIGPPRGR